MFKSHCSNLIKRKIKEDIPNGDITWMKMDMVSHYASNGQVGEWFKMHITCYYKHHGKGHSVSETVKS